MTIAELYECLDLMLHALNTQHKLGLFDNKLDVYCWDKEVLFEALNSITDNYKYEEKPYGLSVWIENK